MQNNFHFLRKLTPAINDKISGLKLIEAYTQDKNELILGFENPQDVTKKFFIKAVVDAKFTGLYFSDEFHRAKRNSVSLLEIAYNSTVKEVVQFENERCFSIVLTKGYQLLFKLFGNRSNIILFKKGVPFYLFNSKFDNDKQLNINQLDRTIDQSRSAFIANEGSLKIVFPTFGKIVQYFLENNLQFNVKQLDDKWTAVSETIRILDEGNFYITKIKGEICLSLLPIGELLETTTDPLIASNLFFVYFNKYEGLDKEKDKISKELNREKKQSEVYLSNSYSRLTALEEGVSNEQKGHILMANLHEILPQQSETLLLNFYTNEPITIKLKKHLSPQKNAEAFYRKAKNEKIEIEILYKNINQKEEKLLVIEKQLEEIAKLSDLKILRNYLKLNNLQEKSIEKTVILPFNKYEFEGFEIFVGKNSKSNDALNKSYSFKDDLWMHVRDAAGSHVLLKHQAGKAFPNYIIEKAASLAAYHSKRRTEGLVPVIVTPKKYVRKLKGMAAGQVIVDKEEVIMVPPENLEK